MHLIYSLDLKETFGKKYRKLDKIMYVNICFVYISDTFYCGCSVRFVPSLLPSDVRLLRSHSRKRETNSIPEVGTQQVMHLSCL